LRDWLRTNDPGEKCINVLTEDTHARRTRLLFQEALGKEPRVGIIAVPNPDYDANHWWRYSEGVRGVIDESIAYAYAKFFFWPASPQAPREGTRPTSRQMRTGAAGGPAACKRRALG
jgi:hypothetical protein